MGCCGGEGLSGGRYVLRFYSVLGGICDGMEIADMSIVACSSHGDDTARGGGVQWDVEDDEAGWCVGCVCCSWGLLRRLMKPFDEMPTTRWAWCTGARILGYGVALLLFICQLVLFETA